MGPCYFPVVGLSNAKPADRPTMLSTPSTAALYSVVRDMGYTERHTVWDELETVVTLIRHTPTTNKENLKVLIRCLQKTPPVWPGNMDTVPPEVQKGLLLLAFGTDFQQIIAGVILDTGVYACQTNIGCTLQRARINALITAHAANDAQRLQLPESVLYPNILFSRSLLTVFLIAHPDRSKPLTAWIKHLLKMPKRLTGLVQIISRSQSGSLHMSTHKCTSRLTWSASTLVSAISAVVGSSEQRPLPEQSTSTMQLLVWRGGPKVVTAAAKIVLAEALVASANARALDRIVVILEELSTNVLGYNALRYLNVNPFDLNWHNPAIRPLLAYLVAPMHFRAYPNAKPCATVAVMAAAASLTVAHNIRMPMELWGVVAFMLGGKLILV